ncbi:carbohydrate-binding protein [Segetibacter koreensis]|uniref:carbohydrate-binding protein n=1 Tax=Segetibacter koreensis TaxID=398037 RepID=UPI00035E5975|nr:carbohydrate-binding protein [Segetibacter koreensis]
MKHLHNISAYGSYCFFRLRLFTCFLVAAILFTGCKKELGYSYEKSGRKSTNLVTAALTQSEILEAELAVLSGAVKASGQTGYTGSGYADFVNTTGDFIEFTVNTSAAGPFLLKFRFANGATTDRPLQLKINGAVVATTLAFPPTGAWSTWALSSTYANLISGANKIRLTTIGYNGPNVDNLNFSSNGLKHLLYMVDNGFNQLIFLNQKDPSKNWKISIPTGSRDLQLVANNKILVSHGNGAAEYDRTTGARGWSISTYSGVSTAQRLRNGNTLLGWSRVASGSTPAKVVLSEVTSAGREVARVTINNITTFRLARRLPNGHTLITGDFNNDLKYKVFEVDGAGTVVWQQLLYGGKGYVANRLTNGNTRATMCPVGNLYQPGKDDNKLLEFGSTGAVVKYWGGMTKHPAARLRKFSGYSVVPANGNILIANWLGDGNTGTGPHAVEFDAYNRLVWSWTDFSYAQTVTNVLVIE